ncbi:MAG TPA: transglycosylase domain-containing protein, partial [Azospirillaceae bacterium]|nr:transglycosylase domain-containing protein [Azospirillaceae bacterium]
MTNAPDGEALSPLGRGLGEGETSHSLGLAAAPAPSPCGSAASLSPGGRGIPRRRVALVAACLLLLGLCLFALDRVFPPDTAALDDLSVQIDDRHGRPLAAFLNHADKFRLPAAPENVSPLFIKLLLAYEDRRFYSHPGVDPLAALRAVGQNLAAGRVVSGASTLTMQAARLLHPAPRGWRAKLTQTFRALQLEARYDKRAILSFYLTLAPYGGNVEGVRAAAWTWFGKGADTLTPGEAALLAA